MSLIKLNDRAVKDVTQFGSISSLGSLTHISTATASASASIEFTLGSYKEYKFFFVNIHGSVESKLQVNFSTDSGSNYNVTKTTTSFETYHDEADTSTSLNYQTTGDLAQSTAFQNLTSTNNIGIENDECAVGYMQLFNPSSTTFVKHFIAVTNFYHPSNYTVNDYIAGYANTTSALTNIKFQMSSGNIDAGEILLFGVN